MSKTAIHRFCVLQTRQIHLAAETSKPTGHGNHKSETFYGLGRIRAEPKYAEREGGSRERVVK